MLYSLIMIIVGFEIIEFVLRAFLPSGRLDNTIGNAMNMVIFSGIIVLCVSIVLNGSIGFLSLDKLIWSKDINVADFDDYVQTYKKIISKALE